MARAIRFHKAGGAEVLQMDDVPVGDPGAGQARIRHTAIGVNFVDTYQRSGRYPMQLPQVAGNEELNKAQMAGSGDLGFEFTKVENFLKFKCDVHPWMFAYITVVDHPYFAVTGKDGTFTIKDVPPGKYTLVAMHRKAALTGVEKEIEVTADGAKQDFELSVPAPK